MTTDRGDITVFGEATQGVVNMKGLSSFTEQLCHPCLFVYQTCHLTLCASNQIQRENFAIYTLFPYELANVSMETITPFTDAYSIFFSNKNNGVHAHRTFLPNSHGQFMMFHVTFTICSLQESVPCNGHGMGCLWPLLLKPTTGGDVIWNLQII